ncbi:MAG: (2Fe-2S)-binding protein [Desulfosarcinaceae bacterium]|jgi:predicted molibdopterin-dependent oxidoreductase YjgC
MADLRIVTAKRGAKLRIRINGHPHTAYEGESVHAALLAAGYRALRTTAKEGQPRGFFCGMGICYECLVTINAIPNQRACMTLVEDNMEITLDG